MKKINLLFTAILLLCCVGTVKAEEVTIDGIKYDVVTKEKHAIVINGGDYSGDIVIPSEITHNNVTHSVTSIGYYAFYDCSGLTSIEIPNSVTSIENYAFYNCSGLTSIEIPNSVTSIGEEAFYGTAWYNNQPDGVVYAGNVLYKYKGTMPSNTSVVVKDGTLGITASAFYGCTGLTSVTIPNSVTSIGNGAFSFCKGLTSITIPNSVTSIGNYAFSNCEMLTSVTIPNSVTSIGNGAFSSCIALTSIKIPNSVTSIGNGAFASCLGLTSIVIEVGNQKYDSRENCNAIIETKSNTLIAGCMNTVIPNSVTSIGERAFYVCYGLTSITIPNSVTSIGYYAFSFLNNLTDVFCLATDVPSTNSYAFYDSYPENITLHVPAEAINSYKTTEPWSNFGNIVEITNTGIMNIPAKAVLVTSNNGTINITCSLEGESVELYTSDAMFIESTTIENGCATIESGLSKGDIAIVKIGEKSIKIIID